MVKVAPGIYRRTRGTYCVAVSVNYEDVHKSGFSSLEAAQAWLSELKRMPTKKYATYLREKRERGAAPKNLSTYSQSEATEHKGVRRRKRGTYDVTVYMSQADLFFKPGFTCIEDAVACATAKREERRLLKEAKGKTV